MIHMETWKTKINWKLHERIHSGKSILKKTKDKLDPTSGLYSSRPHGL